MDLKQTPLDSHLNFWKRTLSVEYIAVLRVATFDPWWKQNGGQDSDLHQMHNSNVIVYAQTALIWKSNHEVCNASSYFDEYD